MKGSAVRIRASASRRLRVPARDSSFPDGSGSKRGLGGGGPPRTLRASFFTALHCDFGCQGRVEIECRRRLDRRRAIRAALPEGLERSLAGPARLFQLRGADRTDEERRLDRGPANRATRLPPLEAR